MALTLAQINKHIHMLLGQRMKPPVMYKDFEVFQNSKGEWCAWYDVNVPGAREQAEAVVEQRKRGSMNFSEETRKRLAGLSINESELVDALRGVFPHGHEDFLPTLVALMELHSQKNHDYAKGGHALGNFHRVANILSNYPDLRLSDPKVVALVYALKQLDAVLWGLNSNIRHKVEGHLGRLDDIAVYATIVQCIIKEETRNREIDRQFGADLPPLKSPAESCGSASRAASSGGMQGRLGVEKSVEVSAREIRERDADAHCLATGPDMRKERARVIGRESSYERDPMAGRY